MKARTGWIVAAGGLVFGLAFLYRVLPECELEIDPLEPFPFQAGAYEAWVRPKGWIGCKSWFAESLDDWIVVRSPTESAKARGEAPLVLEVASNCLGPVVAVNPGSRILNCGPPRLGTLELATGARSVHRLEVEQRGVPAVAPSSPWTKAEKVFRVPPRIELAWGEVDLHNSEPNQPGEQVNNISLWYKAIIPDGENRPWTELTQGPKELREYVHIVKTLEACYGYALAICTGFSGNNVRSFCSPFSHTVACTNGIGPQCDYCDPQSPTPGCTEILERPQHALQATLADHGGGPGQ